MTTSLEKILYVEDDEDLSELTMMVLQDLGGFEVEHCCDGFSAIRKYPFFLPQLILMDVMMPGMDGVDTFKEMKNKFTLEACPVVFMTAKSQVHEQMQYRDVGAIGVLPKPFDPVTLCDEVISLWASHQ
ncbi:hypothetical protein BFP70_09890 [Thioclava sp. SK-1]|uniref:response regulator n=1 Tax=Thioclava sp. SK-1 TaxID=1889770 RepID=UPI0008268701|nr:response regulator [Thioclava sp. SK-1]OCX65365.1 hypothetical protein BFP70_09890 [Thioclava sp. SK-1]